MQPGDGKKVSRNVRNCTWLSLASCRFCRTGAWAKGHLRLNSRANAQRAATATITTRIAIFPRRLRRPDRVWTVLAGVAMERGMMLLEAKASVEGAVENWQTRGERVRHRFANVRCGHGCEASERQLS